MAYHVSEEMVEKYSLGKLREPFLSLFEEHCLVCQHCQDQVSQMDQYHAAFLRAAVRPPSVLQRFWWMLSRPTVRVAVPAFAAGCAAILFFFPEYRSVAPSTVHLTSLRGITKVARLSNSASLTLHLDLRGIDARPSYFAAIASADGALAWTGEVVASAEVATVNVNGSFSKGQYWVRIYNDPGLKDLLREYGLTIE